MTKEQVNTLGRPGTTVEIAKAVVFLV